MLQFVLQGKSLHDKVNQNVYKVNQNIIKTNKEIAVDIFVRLTLLFSKVPLAEISTFLFETFLCVCD